MEWGYVQYVGQSLRSVEHSAIDVPLSCCHTHPIPLLISVFFIFYCHSNRRVHFTSLYFIVLKKDMHFTTHDHI